MTKKVLIVAFHFLPIQGSSGVHRTLAFTKFLPAAGWEPVVLTVNLRAYDQIAPENLRLIPERLRVERAFALNTMKHLAIGGRYLEMLAVPDRWQSWIAGGLLRGLQLVRELEPAAIMSTYPIASAHAIGYGLKRLTGLPWLADFRDPMLQNDFPTRPLERRAFGWIEKRVFRHADAVVVTTSGSRAFYADRYPEATAAKVEIIPNGYDPETFPPLGEVKPFEAQPGRPLKLLHSGLLYTADRNPDNFFAALAALKAAGRISPRELKVVLRASGNEDDYRTRLRALQLDDVVTLEPPLPYREALQEMLDADGLLVFQSAGCNKQIPAKVYEYLYARKPILGLTDPAGDTGTLLHELGIDTLVPLEDRTGIERALPGFLAAIRDNTIALPPASAIERLSRRSGALDLARILDRISNR